MPTQGQTIRGFHEGGRVATLPQVLENCFVHAVSMAVRTGRLPAAIVTEPMHLGIFPQSFQGKGNDSGGISESRQCNKAGPRDPMGNLLATPRMGIRFAKSLA
jgi:hypothetical protein